MSARSDQVAAFLKRWVAASVARDVEATADLYLRDPAPIVAFSDGELARDWLDVRLRLERDYSRVIIDRIDVHDTMVREIADDVLVATFAYEVHGRDMWGLPASASRRGMLTLVRTKDGLRVAAAQFSRAG